MSRLSVQFRRVAPDLRVTLAARQGYSFSVHFRVVWDQCSLHAILRATRIATRITMTRFPPNLSIGKPT